ncbi:MAG TPA: sensor histidine kinase [Rhizomicrobium sp.]|nr:sensor histidine kinase [Rhizomicrobium sp.]
MIVARVVAMAGRLVNRHEPNVSARNAHADSVLRGLLMRELHHRSKNLMQRISSTLQLQAQGEDDAVRAALMKAADRVSAMSQVQAMLYQVGDGEKIPLKTYLEGLCVALRGALQSETSPVTIEVTGDTPIWPEQRVEQVGLLAAEIVSNTLKHAFPGKIGHIGLHIASGRKRCVLTFGDDGIGFDTAQIRRGLGSKLIEAFARQLSADLDIETSPGHGTRVQVGFPIHD